MARFDGAREITSLSIFDTICAPSPNRPAGWTPPADGRLFAPVCRGIMDPLGVTEEYIDGALSGDQTMRVERLVFEARTANVLDLGILRTGLRFEFMVGCKAQPLLPPLLDKIGQDGVARYDYFINPMHVDEDLKALRAQAEKESQSGSDEQREAAKDYLASEWGKVRSSNPACIPARQGFYVCWHAHPAAHKVLCHPETIARVYLVGELTRDVQ